MSSPNTPNKNRKQSLTDRNQTLSTSSSLTSLLSGPLGTVAEDVPILDAIRENGNFRNLSLRSSDEVQTEVCTYVHVNVAVCMFECVRNGRSVTSI